jgi:hypothetical protein
LAVATAANLPVDSDGISPTDWLKRLRDAAPAESAIAGFETRVSEALPVESGTPSYFHFSDNSPLELRVVDTELSSNAKTLGSLAIVLVIAGGLIATSRINRRRFPATEIPVEPR